MSLYTRIKYAWAGMTGDMNVRYHELKHKSKHHPLDHMERSELESLRDRVDHK